MATIGGARLNVDLDLSRAERQIKQLEGRAINLNFSSARPLGKLSADVGEFEKSMAAANARVIAFGVSAAVIGGVATSLHAMVTESVAVEKTLNQLNSTLGTSTSGIKIVGDQLFGLAKNTGQTFQQAAQAATEFSRQSLGTAEVLKRTNDALILARISGQDYVSVVKSLTAATNSFAKEGLTTNEIVNRFAAVSQRFGVSVKDLDQAISGIGESASAAKVGFNELIALVTRVQQTTSKGGAEIGVAFKTIFSRIERRDTLDSLDQLGVAVRTVQGNTLPAIQVLTNLARTYDKLGDSQREQVAELLGGVRQVSILKTALGDLNSQYSIYKNVLNAANGATDEATRRNAELNKTISASSNEALQNLTKLAAASGSLVFGPTIKKVLGGINDGSNLLDGDSIGKTVGESILRGIGNALSGPGLVAGGFLAAKLLKSFGDFAIKAAGSVLEIGKASEKEAAVQQGINALLQQTPGLYASILAQARSVTEQEELTLAVIKQQSEAQATRGAFVKNVSSGLVNQGVRFSRGEGRFRVPTAGAAEEAEELLAGGHIPYINKEISAAAREGYSVLPDQVRQMTAKIDGKATNVTYNTREKVIQNFANTGEPAIIPPGKSLSKLMLDKIHSAQGFVPNFADGPTNLKFSEKDFAAIGYTSEEEQQFTLRELLRQALRGDYNRAKEDENLFGIEGLTKDKLSTVKFTASAKTSTLEDILGQGPRNSPLVSEAHNNFDKLLQTDAEKIVRRSRGKDRSAMLERLASDPKYAHQIVPSSRQGILLEKAIGDAYGIEEFSFNNARFDIRAGLNSHPDKMKQLLNDFNIPLSVKNVDLKRTVGSKRVAASFTNKALFGSNLADEQFDQLLGSLHQLEAHGVSKEGVEQFKTLLKTRRIDTNRAEELNLSGLNQNKGGPNYLAEFAEKHPELLKAGKTPYELFGDGYIPNLAQPRFSEEQLQLARKISQRIFDFPLAERQSAINGLLGNSLKFGASNSELSGNSGLFVPSGASGLSLNLDLPTQVGALLAPRAYENAGGNSSGIHVIDRSKTINTLGVKAFDQGDYLFGNPDARGTRSAPFKTAKEIEEYLITNLKGQGLEELARRVQTISNPNAGVKGQPKNLKEGLGLNVTLRDLPLVDVEKTDLGPAYRSEVRRRNLRPTDKDREYGNVVQEVLKSAVDRELGRVTSETEGIDLPGSILSKVLGVDIAGTAPLGLDAKSSIDKENTNIRSLLKKGNRNREGLGVFNQHLDDALSREVASSRERQALSALLRRSSGAFLSGGFIPNLVSQMSGEEATTSGLVHNISGLNESIGRELKNTGISLSQVRVNFSDNPSHPPISVTNTRDEGRDADPQIGLNRVAKQGGNPFLAGSGQEFKGSGFIPNLAFTDADDFALRKSIAEKRAAGDFKTPGSEEAYRRYQRKEISRQTTDQRVEGRLEEARLRHAETHGRDFTAAEEGVERNNQYRYFQEELGRSGQLDAQRLQEAKINARRRQSPNLNENEFFNKPLENTDIRYNTGLDTGKLSVDEQISLKNKLKAQRFARENNTGRVEAQARERAESLISFGPEFEAGTLGAGGFAQQIGPDDTQSRLRKLQSGEIQGGEYLSEKRRNGPTPLTFDNEVGEVSNLARASNAVEARGVRGTRSSAAKNPAGENGSGERVPQKGGGIGGQHAAFAIAFAAPLLGGAVANNLSDPTDQRKAEGVTSAIGSGAALASLGGPLGLTAGIGVALVGSFKTLVDNVKPSFEDLAKKTQDLAAKKKEETDSIGRALQAQSSLDEAIKAGASASQLRAAQTQYSSSLNAITDPNIRSRLLTAKTPDERNSILADSQAQSEKEVGASNALASAASVEEKFKTGFFSGNLLGLKKSSFEAEGFGGDLLRTARPIVDLLGRGTDQQVSNESIAAVKSLANQTAQAGDEGAKNIPQIKERLSDDLQRVFDIYYNSVLKSSKAVQEASEVHLQYQTAVAGLNSTITRLTTARQFSQQISENRDDASYSIKSNNLRNLTEFNRPYLSESANAQIAFNTGNIENDRNYLTKNRELQAQVSSAFLESSNDPSISNQGALTELRSGVLQNKGGQADIEDLKKLAELGNQDNQNGIKTNQILLDLVAKQDKATQEFAAQKEILKQNYQAARQQAYANRLNGFLGSASLTTIDQSSAAARANAESNILRRGTDERRNHTFGIDLANAPGIQGAGGVGRVLNQQRRQQDSDAIAIAGDVKEQVSQGLIPSLDDHPEFGSFSKLNRGDQNLIVSSRKSLEQGFAATKYQDLENRANTIINPQLIGQAGIYNETARGNISDAIYSRGDSEKISNAISSVNQSLASRGGGTEEQRGAANIIVRELTNLGQNNKRVQPAAEEQAKRTLQGGEIPAAIKDATHSLQTDNEKALAKYDKIITQAEASARNTGQTIVSIQRLGELLKSQSDAAKKSQDLDKAVGQRTDLQKEQLDSQSKLDDDSVSRSRLTANRDAFKKSVAKSVTNSAGTNAEEAEAGSSAAYESLTSGGTKEDSVNAAIQGVRSYRAKNYKLHGLAYDEKLIISQDKEKEYRASFGGAIQASEDTKGILGYKGIVDTKNDFRNRQKDIDRLGEQIDGDRGLRSQAKFAADHVEDAANSLKADKPFVVQKEIQTPSPKKNEAIRGFSKLSEINDFAQDGKHTADAIGQFRARVDGAASQQFAGNLTGQQIRYTESIRDAAVKEARETKDPQQIELVSRLIATVNDLKAAIAPKDAQNATDKGPVTNPPAAQTTNQVTVGSPQINLSTVDVPSILQALMPELYKILAPYQRADNKAPLPPSLPSSS